MTARVLRLVRPLVVTGAVWVLPAGAHVLGGGRLPAAEISVALMALVWSAVTLVLGRRLFLGRVVGVPGIGQVLLHEAFSPFSREAAGGTSLHGSGHHAEQAGACRTQGPEPLARGLRIHHVAGASPGRRRDSGRVEQSRSSALAVRRLDPPSEARPPARIYPLERTCPCWIRPPPNALTLEEPPRPRIRGPPVHGVPLARPV